MQDLSQRDYTRKVALQNKSTKDTLVSHIMTSTIAQLQSYITS